MPAPLPSRSCLDETRGAAASAALGRHRSADFAGTADDASDRGIGDRMTAASAQFKAQRRHRVLLPRQELRRRGLHGRLRGALFITIIYIIL